MLNEIIERVVELKSSEEITQLDTVVEDCGDIIPDFEGYYFVVPKDKIPLLDEVCRECSPKNYSHMKTVLAIQNGVGIKIIIDTARKMERTSIIEYLMEQYDNNVDDVFEALGFGAEQPSYYEEEYDNGEEISEFEYSEEDTNSELVEQGYEEPQNYNIVENEREGEYKQSRQQTSEQLTAQMDELAKNMSSMQGNYCKPQEVVEPKVEPTECSYLTREELVNLLELIKQADPNQSMILIETLLNNYDAGGESQVTSLVLGMLDDLEKRGLL